MAPRLAETIETSIKNLIIERDNRINSYLTVPDSVTSTVKVQFIAYGFVESKVLAILGRGTSELLQLTSAGKKALVETKVVRSQVRDQ
jgi:hypothetical protein